MIKYVVLVALSLNNPGNIERGEHWKGMSQVQHSERFVEYQSKTYGYRAMAIVLMNYQKLHGIQTLNGIIYRYAPMIDNNTEAYVEYVCAKTGYTKYKSIDLTNPDILFSVMKAMARFEQGSTFDDPDSIIKRGIKRAIEDGDK